MLALISFSGIAATTIKPLAAQTKDSNFNWKPNQSEYTNKNLDLKDIERDSFLNMCDA